MSLMNDTSLKIFKSEQHESFLAVHCNSWGVSIKRVIWSIPGYNTPPPKARWGQSKPFASGLAGEDGQPQIWSPNADLTVVSFSHSSSWFVAVGFWCCSRPGPIGSQVHPRALSPLAQRACRFLSKTCSCVLCRALWGRAPWHCPREWIWVQSAKEWAWGSRLKKSMKRKKALDNTVNM